MSGQGTVDAVKIVEDNPWLNLRAQIRGLISPQGKALNGLYCDVQGYNAERQRFVCKLDDCLSSQPILMQEEHLQFTDLSPASEMKLFAARDSKLRATSVPESDIPAVLLVKGDTFDYQGKYILQSEKHDGRPVWKSEHFPRYINFHSIGYWLLGTFGPTTPNPHNLTRGERSIDGGRQVKGGFPESNTGWVQGFDFRARSFADTPDLIPCAQWEQWMPQGLFGFSTFGWFPTRQVRLHSGSSTSPKPLLQVDVTSSGYTECVSDEYDFVRDGHVRAQCFNGDYILQKSKVCGLPVWRCAGRSRAEVRDIVEGLDAQSFEDSIKKGYCDFSKYMSHQRRQEQFISELWESCESKPIQYSSERKAWMIRWESRHDELLHASSALTSPELFDVYVWRMVSPGYFHRGYSTPLHVYISQPEPESRADHLPDNAPSCLRKDEILRGAPPRLLVADNNSRTEFRISPEIHAERPVWKSLQSSEWIYYNEKECFWMIRGATLGNKVARYRAKSWAPFPHTIPDSASNEHSYWEFWAPKKEWLPKPHTNAVYVRIYLDAEEPGTTGLEARISVLTYSRSTQMFREALMQGPQLQPCRQALEDAGFHAELPCGAKVFVQPELYEAVVRELEGQDLKPRHVIVAEEFERCVDAAIRSLPSKEQSRPKGEKIGLRVPFPTPGVRGNHPASSASAVAASSFPREQDTLDSDSEQDGSGDNIIYQVCRTFIHVPLPSSMQSKPSTGPKTVSTSAARSAINPRRHKLNAPVPLTANHEDRPELLRSPDIAHAARSQQIVPCEATVTVGRRCSPEERSRWMQKLNHKDTMIMMLIPNAPEHVRADKEIMLAVICRPGDVPYGDILEYSPMELRGDRDFIWRCVEHDAGVLDFTTPELLADRALILHAAQHDPFNTWRFAPREFRTDREFVATIVRGRQDLYPLIPEQLKRDCHVMAALREGQARARQE